MRWPHGQNVERQSVDMPSHRRTARSTTANWAVLSTPSERISFAWGIVLRFCASKLRRAETAPILPPQIEADVRLSCEEPTSRGLDLDHQREH